MGPDHSPLSKRHGATSVAEFRAKGYLPEALVNYLALIGWSPGRRRRDCCRSTSWRAASRSTRVGHSAGVFDEEKLAWVNRHYLKMADPSRLAELSLPYFKRRRHRDDARRGAAWSFSRRRCRWRPASVDRLDQVPARLAFLFDYDRRARRWRRPACGPRCARTARGRSSRALAEELAAAPRLDRETFRAVGERR